MKKIKNISRKNIYDLLCIMLLYIIVSFCLHYFGIKKDFSLLWTIIMGTAPCLGYLLVKK